MRLAFFPVGEQGSSINSRAQRGKDRGQGKQRIAEHRILGSKFDQPLHCFCHVTEKEEGLRLEDCPSLCAGLGVCLQEQQSEFFAGKRTSRNRAAEVKAAAPPRAWDSAEDAEADESGGPERSYERRFQAKQFLQDLELKVPPNPLGPSSADGEQGSP